MKNLIATLVIVLSAAGEISFGANHTVVMNGFSFSPATLKIAKGDSVTWTNASPATPHNTKSGSGCVANSLWSSDNIGGHGVVTFTFNDLPAPSTNPYFCSLHCSFGMVGTLIVTNAPNSAPSVSITNPAAGARFLAPANITVAADATDDGNVTNVEFFLNGASIGNVTSPPFSLLANNLAAGNYSFVAKASDNLGVAATSAVVNLSVLTNAVLSPIRMTNGQFQFTIHGISNQSYTTEMSSNLATWIPLSTNMAPADDFDVIDSTGGAAMRFYRVRQDY